MSKSLLNYLGLLLFILFTGSLIFLFFPGSINKTNAQSCSGSVNYTRTIYNCVYNPQNLSYSCDASTQSRTAACAQGATCRACELLDQTCSVNPNGSGCTISNSSVAGQDGCGAGSINVSCGGGGGPTPTPACAYECCYDSQCGSGHCNTSTHTCRHNGCNASNQCVWFDGDGSNGCPNGSSDCTATPTPTPAAGQCTAANCSGQCAGCSLNGASCQTKGSYCSAGSCVCGWSAGSACDPAACQTPTPAPSGGGGGGVTCGSGDCTPACATGTTCSSTYVNGAYGCACMANGGGHPPPLCTYCNGFNQCSALFPQPASCATNCSACQFGPPATCTSLTANPSTIPINSTSNLTATGCTNVTLAQWTTTCGSVQNQYAFTSNIYTAPSTGPQICWATVNVCGPGGNCNAYSTSISVFTPNTPTPTPTPTPTTYTILGNIFIDTNENQIKDAGESNYSGAITVTSSNGGVVTYPTSGAFNIASLTAGSHTISYTSLPSGYHLTYPLNGPPPSFTVTVGTGCSVGGSNSATCNAGNNITNLNFGISSSTLPWIQIIGSDIRTDGGFTAGGGGAGGGGGSGTSTFSNPVPLTAIAACGGAYTSIPGSTSTTPGMIFSGNGTPDFGQGSASVNNWAVGGISYPETFNPIRQGGIIKTSYAYMQSVAKQAGITPVDLAGTDVNGQPYCSGGIANCVLSPTLPHGIYVANGNLTLTGSSYTFLSNQNYIILVNGDLNIQTAVHVPVGSTLMFSVSGSIYVGPTVGVSDYTLSTSNIEGVFSADKNFVVQGAATCPSSPDLKLNVAGAIIVNAALGGGSFQNQRDLCGGNAYCPVFTVAARPDFILNAPSFVKKSNNIYQEVAP